jgi:hypothetical protein
MRNRYAYLLSLTAILFALIIASCNKNPQHTTDRISMATTDASRTAFARLLSKAVEEKEVRDLLKNEAQKRFDADWDVLYVMVKNKPLPSGRTLEQHLQKLSAEINTGQSLQQMEANLPLLTILVPRFEKFSAANWNTDAEVPLVVARNLKEMKATGKYKAVDSQGQITELDAHKHPIVPVIFVKDNEALEIIAEKEAPATAVTMTHKDIEKYPAVFKYKGMSYYFSDPTLYKRTQQTYSAANEQPAVNARGNGTLSMGCPRVMDFDKFDIRVRESWDKGIYNPICPENTATVRDYVYYGIDPTTGVTSGPLRYNYRETLTSIRCESVHAQERFDDAGEGDIIEFEIIAYTVDNDPLFPLNKRLSVPTDDLFVTDATNPNPRAIDLTSNHLGLSPLEFSVWNFKRQGDGWKFAIIEYDPSTTISQTNSISATLGTNFSAGDEKTGGKFGLSATVQVTKSVTISRTDASDPLGDATSLWCDPVIRDKWRVTRYEFCGWPHFYPRPPRGGVDVARSYDMGTGYIAITVEPRAF